MCLLSNVDWLAKFRCVRTIEGRGLFSITFIKKIITLYYTHLLHHAAVQVHTECVCGGILLWICIFLVEPVVDTLGNFFF